MLGLLDIETFSGCVTEIHKEDKSQWTVFTSTPHYSLRSSDLCKQHASSYTSVSVKFRIVSYGRNRRKKTRSRITFCYTSCYLGFKKPSNLRRIPLLKRGFQEKEFASQNFSVSLKFTTLSAWPLVLQGKWCFRGLRRVEHNTSNLRRALIFSPERRKRKRDLNSK